MADIEFTRLDTRDSWMEAMATLTDSEDEETVGIATLPSFKRRTGEDAVRLHDHDVAVAHDHDGAGAHDHDGAGAHDQDPLRCHHSTFKRRTVTVRCCKFAAKIHSRGPECSPQTSVHP